MMLPPVSPVPAERTYSPAELFPDYVRLSRSANPTYRPFTGTIPPKWHKAARKNGFTLIGRVKDRLHVALLCHVCGCTHAKRVSVVLGYSPECPHCIKHQRIEFARTVGAVLLGRDPKNRHYGHYRLACGHQVRRQFHRVALAANGGHNLGCETCREDRYRAQARKFGWDLLGPTSSGKSGYRSYRHTCGNTQNIMVGNMLWGDCACSRCSLGRTAQPSHIYLFQIGLPGLPVIKLGYSARPAKRLKHQLGIDKGIATEVLRVVNLPTGHEARTEEEHMHRTLTAQFPDMVVVKDEYGDAINVTREIYRPEAASIIHRFLDEIETRFPDTNSQVPDIAA